MSLPKHHLELLSPARDVAIAREAILHGADAVYIGGPSFGARHNACNDVSEIAQLVEFARRYHARVFTTINTILHDNELEPARQLIHQLYDAAFYFYAAASLVAYMMEDRLATTDELFAAGAAFTLLAWAFTHVFILVQALQPGTFGAAVNAADPRTWTELNYLSFALLSSTGIGDVIPLTSHARAIASVEMLVGLMYLAAVVARLIGFTLQSNKS
eukprot:gene39016-48183_t